MASLWAPGTSAPTSQGGGARSSTGASSSKEKAAGGSSLSSKGKARRDGNGLNPGSSKSARESGKMGGTSTATDAAARGGLRGENCCPQCGATFGNPVELVAHVEARHANGGGSTSTSAFSQGLASLGLTTPAPHEEGPERCPRCGKGFKDIVSLVSHVESKHTGRSKSEQCLIQ